MTETLEELPSAQAIVDEFRAICTSYIQLAQKYVRVLDVRGEALKEECIARGFPRKLLLRLEQLGRGQLDERLLFAAETREHCLLLYPLSEQQRALNDGVDVLDPDEETVRHIPFDDLTPKQAMLALGVRRQQPLSIAEQRTLIREEKAKTVMPEIEPEAYRVLRDFVEIRKPGRFSKKVVKQWLDLMK